MDICYISPEYQSSTYFNFFQENMFGLSPMTTDDPDLLARQFLHQFVNTGDQKDLGLEESYAFDGGSTVTLGATLDELNSFDSFDHSGEHRDFTNKGLQIDDAMPEATATMNFAPVMYYKGTDLLLKINNYVPPIKEELDQQQLSVNTWQRETKFPPFFYDYFMENFMIPAFTCDQMRAQDLAYPGIWKTYSCYCNNGDYHSMPTINFEITGKNFQYDMGPSQYMFLPYLNYTQPMSLCVLGIDNNLWEEKGIQYGSLGQRAMASFPFYAIFDRETGSAKVELAGASHMGGPDKMGAAIAISIAVLALMLALVIYLIVLRKNRLACEEWLLQNKHILFTHAKNLKSEEEILEELVKGKELRDQVHMSTHNTPPARQIGSMNSDYQQPMIDTSDPAPAQPSQNGLRNRSPSTSKQFTNDPAYD